MSLTDALQRILRPEQTAYARLLTDSATDGAATETDVTATQPAVAR